MTTKMHTFTKTSHFGKSFVCASVLFFCVYAVLPLSISADLKAPEPEEITRVYTVEDSVSETYDPAPKESISNNFTASVPVHTHPIERAPYFTPDYAGCSLPLTNVGEGGSGNFELTGFAMSNEGFKIETFELSELDSIPRRISRVRVKYPPEMLRRGIEGIVRLNVTIDETGTLEVESVAESTNEAFEASAIEAARSLKYEIPKKNGLGVRAKFVLPIPFRIQR